jgi:hypothetical protein
MIREDLQRIKTVAEGRTVFIVGGGVSATPEVFAKLNNSDAKIFCINSSVKYIERPIGVLWCDESWAAINKDTLDKYTFPKFYVKNGGSAYIKTGLRAQSNATVLNKTGESGLDCNLDNVRGNNSGGYAINLLINCKVRTIVLVGFDMQTVGNKAHFHSEYTYAVRPSVYKDLFIPSIESLNTELNKHKLGISIYNTNKFSKLRCFEFRELEDFL